MSIYNAEYSKLYRAKNLEKVRAWDRAKYLKRKASGVLKEYEKKNAHKIAENGKRYRMSAKGRATKTAYDLRNQKKKSDDTRIWRNKNRERVKAVKLAWYHRTKEKYADHYRALRVVHAEEKRAQAKARRALKKGATVNLKKITAFMKASKSKRAVSCYYCLIQFPSKNIHFDHIIPLSKGGLHSVENLCVSCPKCNLSKSDKPIAVFIKTGQQLFSL